jgi:hypothetical protein
MHPSAHKKNTQKAGSSGIKKGKKNRLQTEDNKKKLTQLVLDDHHGFDQENILKVESH